MSNEINQWITKTNIGERSEMPTIPDRVWKLIGWNDSMACDICSNRGFCKLVKEREQYRTTSDILIVDHDIYFQDLWTREDRRVNGKLPILPSYSAVIFNEGHKILIPAAMHAGQHISKEEIDYMILAFEQIQGARASLSLATSAMETRERNYDCMEKVVTTTEKLLLQNNYLDMSKKHDQDEDEKDYIEYDDDDWGNDF